MTKQEEIRSALNELSPLEARQRLRQIITMMENTECSAEGTARFYEHVKMVYQEILAISQQRPLWEPNDVCERVHLVFGDSIAGTAKIVIRQTGCFETNKLIVFNDVFSMGPVWQLDQEKGRKNRAEWFRDNINNEGEEPGVSDRAYLQNLHGMIARIPARAAIVIWTADNAHEQVGLRFALSLLKHRLNDIYVFHTGHACGETNGSAADTNYSYSGTYAPEQLLGKCSDLAHNGPISRETRRILEQEWYDLREGDGVLRIWDGKRVCSVDAGYCDNALLETAGRLQDRCENDGFVKVPRVIGEVLGNSHQHIDDRYLEYRLRHLICNGSLAIKGVPRAMREYSVRLK